MSQTSSRNLTFWFEGLLNPQRVLEASEPLKQARLPSLQKLLSKADYHFSQKRSQSAMASYLFHQSRTLPAAATSVQSLSVVDETKKSLFWLSIDPVQMVPDRDTLVLIPAIDIGITEEESRALLQSFNEHFAEDGIELIYGSATQWFMSIAQPVAIQTTPLAQVAYQSLNGHYPEGAAGNYWRQLMNETQMLFYNHEVNHQRRMQNLPEVNSVWVWGEGQINPADITSRAQASLFSNQSYSRGMAKLCGAQSFDAVNSYASWQSYQGDVVHSLVELDAKIYAGMDMDLMTLEQWLQLLDRLEQDWFVPILNALASKELDSVLFVLGANKHFLLKPSHLKRFWRLNKRWSGLAN